MKKESLWSTRLGVYFAAIGAAVGLGNIWRFPFVVAENGGGAFVLIYVFTGLIVGVPLLTSELMLGRLTRKGILAGAQDVLEASSKQTSSQKKLVKYFGQFVIAVSFLMLSYLLLISSWVFYLFIEFFKSFFVELPYSPEKMLSQLKNNFFYQSVLIVVNLVVVLTVVVRGVEKQVERWVSFLLPFFIVLLVVLMIKSLSLNLSTQAMRYFFYPDFTKLNLTSLSYALGQVMFTLSIGIGLTVSFGRYLNPKFNIPLTGFRVAAIDSTLSLFAGMLVFPLVLSGFYDVSQAKGPLLVFEAIPSFLLRIEYGKFYAMALFVFLLISALGACIGLFETLVSNLKEKKKKAHRKTSCQVASLALVLTFIPALFFSRWGGVKVSGKSLFELFDLLVVNLMLPLSCLVIVFLLLRYVTDSVRRAEFFGQSTVTDEKMYVQWLFALKFIIPIFYILTFSLLVIHFVTKT